MMASAQNQQSNVVALKPSRLPLNPAIAKQFDITSDQWRVLVDQLFPSAKTIESVMMALSYCRQRNLDIFKKPVHIVPMWSSAVGGMVETVWPGIAEVRTTAARTGEYAGIEEVVFGPMVTRTFSGRTKDDGKWVDIQKDVTFPEWASVVVYRFVKGEKCAFHTKIFWEETYASIGKSDVPNDMWARRPRGQFDKCVEAAGLRRAFPEELGSTYAAEEMEGRTLEGYAHDVTAAKAEAPTPPVPPKPPAPTPAIEHQAVQTVVPSTPEVREQMIASPQAPADIKTRIGDEMPDFLRRTGQKQETAVEQEIIDAEIIDPADLLKEADQAFTTAQDVEALSILYEEYKDRFEFPPDQTALYESMKRNEKRLERAAP